MHMLLAHDLGLLPAGDDDDDRFGHPARPYAWQEILSRARHGRVRNQEEDYKPEYTHPGKPESGFTFDFAPPSSTEVSSSHAKGKAAAPPVIIDLEADVETDISRTGSSGAPSSPGPSSFQTLLVCAKCLDPLVLGAGLVGEEVRTSKVWALRCGHLIDGKCLDFVGVPVTGHVDLDKGNDAEEGNGKARALDIKGKGKAKALEELSSSAETNPIRSRLRSRANGHLPTSFSSPAPSSSRSTRILATPPAQTLLGKRKRTSSSIKNKLEAKHEWECPVAGCKRVHVSVHKEGVWVPEPDTPVPTGKGKSKWSLARSEVTGGRGAVAVYV
jgi:hypothetical protein